MTTASHAQQVELYRCSVSLRTDWLLLRLTDSDGVTGWGECSDAGPVAAVLRQLDGWAEHPLDGGAFTRTTLLGGFQQARADQAARRAGLPLWQWLGGTCTTSAPSVELYATLNRAPGGRAPAALAATAEAAVRSGFRMVKLSPFDSPGGDRLAHLGLARVRAVREAVGAGAELLVDCRERLPLSQLTRLLHAFAELRIGWLQGGVGIDRPEELAELRARTDIPLAGGEFAATVEELKAVAGLLDVVTPDVRHAGGPAAVLALAAAGSARVSLHNPAGPIATLHSAQLAVQLPAEPLEYAFGEVPWRGDLLGGAEQISGGRLTLPSGPGLGAEPDLRHPSVTPLWRGTVDLAGLTS
ncbi:L-alanine-DL-glutamate epimerase-like enolase superfamily enzyme [Kitasatospora sp. MAA4]|uniref:enolase C-terminal domain-like protein n=1 Tax=Kitasatospora sp. MAA4 TaxID=3035093 RepID=UPI0024765E79|nr:enolase C-terminal domain-like protein [Kitasatospora sp. MAA4]MDH6134872.1 L-alanine-DL-glutamate epimerase-like enolase superfamily enzyme [Kitasatospora sp. MAA4]